LLKQILINLLDNAIKFSAQKPVQLDIVVLVENDSHAQLHIQVRDGGKGMDRQQLENIFNAFYTTNDSNYDDQRGVGLGLMLCKRFAGILGGDIVVESNPGEGSCFSLQLPVKLATQQDLVSTTEQGRSDLKGLHLLLVEDNDVNREVIQQLLTSLGADVILASNGEDALNKLLHDKITVDLVLMDMEMPVMDGYTAVKQLRDGSYKGVVIALTAGTFLEEQQRCMDAGCDDYASKPITRDGLRTLCLQHWQQK
jgi:two-component system sensor kinase